jgi:hypothetical protein
MPVYLQIIILIFAVAIFFLFLLLVAGWGIRRLCFKIIAELEKAGAFSATKAIKLPDERQNFFRVGTGNLRPKALNVLISDEIVVKAGNGKYYLNKEKLADVKAQQTGK